MIPCLGTGKFENILCLLEKMHFQGCQVALKEQRNQVTESSCSNLSVKKIGVLTYMGILFILLSMHMFLQHLGDIVKNSQSIKK